MEEPDTKSQIQLEKSEEVEVNQVGLEQAKLEKPGQTEPETPLLIEFEESGKEEHKIDSTNPSTDVKVTNSSTNFSILSRSSDEQPRKKLDEDKSAIYKALAIKLKKELVKTREDFQNFKEESKKQSNDLNNQVKLLNETLEEERKNFEDSCATITTLEAKTKNLKQQLENSDAELVSLQKDYENYKLQASKIMQQNAAKPSNHQRCFDEDMFKWLKEQKDVQSKQITNLEDQLSKCSDENKSLLTDMKSLREKLENLNDKMRDLKAIENRCELLSRENENLKLAMKQFRHTYNEFGYKRPPNSSDTGDAIESIYDETVDSNREGDSRVKVVSATAPNNVSQILNEVVSDPVDEENTSRVSPVASIKDGSQSNSGSSFDGSTSGYVHIKPMTFEIVSKSSMHDDAQNQIDNLTKAYLDSESTNSLLSDQVKALKEEIRRLQRGNDRLDLAENLEYLKNVVFKYLALDNNQVEQRQRLIPVLSTVLKLSPDEVGKLNSTISSSDRSSMASSFFKL